MATHQKIKMKKITEKNEKFNEKNERMKQNCNKRSLHDNRRIITPKDKKTIESKGNHVPKIK